MLTPSATTSEDAITDPEVASRPQSKARKERSNIRPTRGNKTTRSPTVETITTKSSTRDLPAAVTTILGVVVRIAAEAKTTEIVAATAEREASSSRESRDLRVKVTREAARATAVEIRATPVAPAATSNNVSNKSDL